MKALQHFLAGMPVTEGFIRFTIVSFHLTAYAQEFPDTAETYDLIGFSINCNHLSNNLMCQRPVGLQNYKELKLNQINAVRGA